MVIVVTTLSQPVVAVKFSTTVPTCEGSHVVALIVILYALTNVVIVVTVLSQPLLAVKFSTTVPSLPGIHVCALIVIL